MHRLPVNLPFLAEYHRRRVTGATAPPPATSGRQQGAPRANRDWVVYRRTTEDGPEQVARRRDTEQRNIGLDLMIQKRFTEAADFFRDYAKQSDSKEWIYLRGFVLLESGSTAEARAAFEQAIYYDSGKEISKREQIYVAASQKRIGEMDHPAL